MLIKTKNGNVYNVRKLTDDEVAQLSQVQVENAKRYERGRQAGKQKRLFRWITMRDEKVSTGPGGHKQLDGKIFDLDDPATYPVISSSGFKGLPHLIEDEHGNVSESLIFRPNCRCRAVPVKV